MGEIHEPIPVKPICAILYAPSLNPAEIKEKLISMLGSIERESGIFPFDYTTYYEKEMGADLQKQYMSFEKLMHPGKLPDLKLGTNAIESEWSRDGKRSVNLDPGYITAAKLVLASTKDFAHRVYLGDSIYGDVQLRFTRGAFQVAEWTYPDYQSEMALQFFTAVRERFNEQDKTV